MKLEIEYVLTNDMVLIEEIIEPEGDFAVDYFPHGFVDRFWKKLNENDFVLVSPLIVDKDKVRSTGPVHLLNVGEIRYVRFFEVAD